MTVTTTPDLSDDDIAELLLPMIDRQRILARASARYAVLSRQNTVAGLLRETCREMEGVVLELALTLRADLQIHIGPSLRADLLNTAAIKHALTKRFRLGSFIGCVDLAIQTMVLAFTGGLCLTAAQYRLASDAIRRADCALVLIALDADDLLEAKFGCATRGDAAARWELLLALPHLAHDGIPVGQDIYNGGAVFERLACGL